LETIFIKLGIVDRIVLEVGPCY